jgi:signal transduction histidine kinase
MRTFGHLAAGIMHDMETFIRGMGMHLHDANEGLSDGGDPALVLQAVQTSQKLLGALGKICRGLRNYGSGDETKKGRVCLFEAISQTAEFLRHAFPKTTEIVLTRVGDEKIVAHANETQVLQILANLIRNAVQALPNKMGRVTVYVHSLHRQQDEELVSGSVRGAKFVAFSVKDDGAGMSPETFQEISKCFFTTRRESGGTGLGLFMVNRLAHENGGHVVASTKRQYDGSTDHGSIFTVYLPRAT